MLYKLILRALDSSYTISLSEEYIDEVGKGWKVDKTLMVTSNPTIASTYIAGYLEKLDVKCWHDERKMISPFVVEYVITPTEALWEMIERQSGLRE